MSFPRYPKYKASGVEWLGEVPEHWSAGRLRHFARRYSGGTPDKTNLGYWQDGVIPWLNSGAVNDRLISEPSTLITAEAFANSSAKWVPAGALVMALAGQGKTKGMVAQLAIPSTCNQSMAAIVPNPTMDARFLFWWLDSNYQSIRNLAGGDLRDGLNLELVGDIPLPVVPLPEQTAIAEFLDRETGNIDELVAEQRRLMELLKEKRQAVISHAVTKGLNPHAPMKPSGIKWLGDVPVGWTISALKWLTQPDRPIMYGIVLPGPDVGDGVPILKGGNIKPSRMNLESMARTTPEIEEKFARARLREGDLVYAIRGTIGDCEKVPQEMEGSNITQDVARVAIDETNCAGWARWALLASAIQEDLACGSLGAAVRGINIFDLKRVKIPTPPPAEQREISTFLDRETSKLDTLTAESQRAIDLLQERRTALISAAVTGQIDVRNYSKTRATA
jgi:type I restriction enzyme S subunit